MSLARPLAAGAAALVAAVALAGCGGGGSDSLSADEFRSQADAICADANAKTDALGEPTSAATFLPYLRAGLPIQEAQLGKLEALKPPSELQDAYSEALDLLKQKQAAVTAAADRIEGGEDTEAVVKDVSDDIDAIDEQADAKAEGAGPDGLRHRRDRHRDHLHRRRHRDRAGHDDRAGHHRGRHHHGGARRHRDAGRLRLADVQVAAAALQALRRASCRAPRASRSSATTPPAAQKKPRRVRHRDREARQRTSWPPRSSTRSARASWPRGPG